MTDKIAEALYKEKYQENIIDISIGNFVIPVITAKTDNDKTSYYLFDKLKIINKKNYIPISTNKDYNINICLACDNNYAKYAGVTIASILSNANKKDCLNFYILDGGINNKYKEEILSLKSIKDCVINFINIDNNLFKKYQNVQTHTYLTIPSFYRLKLAEILPNVNKIIYLDCDTIVNSSLSDLNGEYLGNNIIAGVQDINKRIVKNNPYYVNSGVLLIDLNKIRKENIERHFLEYVENNFAKIKTGDQEIINAVLKDRIKLINETWNVQSSNFTNRSSYTNEPRIIHFVAKKKPWHFGSFSWHKEFYFKYLQLTPWKLNKKDLEYWTKKNKIMSIIGYLKYRPLFFLRPRFYKALYYSYIKPLFNKSKKKDIKTFLIFNTACLGDILLCNSLCQNIKFLYPNSRIIYIVDKPFYDIAKHQKDVDDVVIFDKKNKNKGFWGIIKFIKNFPYKKADVAFSIYRNERNIILAKLIKTKKILYRDKKETAHVQREHVNLLRKITNKTLKDFPIKFIANDKLSDKLQSYLDFKNKNYITLCTISKRIEKDLEIIAAEKLINKINSTKINNKSYEIIYCGIGDRAEVYAQELKKRNCKFINLCNKTSLLDLATILKLSKASISVDTGTMHLSYSLQTPTLCIFNEEKNIKYWAPNPKIYPFTKVITNTNSQTIIEAITELIGESNHA